MTFLETIKEILSIIMGLTIIGLIVLTGYLMYVNMIEKPYDDGTNHLELKERYWKSVYCKANTCNITFDSNVSDIGYTTLTGSMLPIIGGNDVYVCLNKTPKPGDIVLVGDILHMVYKIEDETWILTKGKNNPILDDQKFPIGQIDCVIALVIR